MSQVIGLFVNPPHQRNMLQHDLNCWWLTDRHLQQVIKYYGLEKIYWESE